MNKFDTLYNDILNEVKASPSNFSNNPVKPVGTYANRPLDIKPGYDAIQNTINKKLAAKDSKWFEQYIPYGYRETKRYNLGVHNGREFVAWIVPDEGEMTYNYYVVYKDEGKEHWIDREDYDNLFKGNDSQRTSEIS
jgi:hypothetical protein